MTEKELLESVAKAAGYIPVGESEEGNFLVSMDGNKTYGAWDPLDNDGQALRLAVKLDMDVEVLCGEGLTVAHTNWTTSKSEAHKDDPYAATRRAIVRAAAEIGRSMG